MKAVAEEKLHGQTEDPNGSEAAEKTAGPRVITAKTAGFCFGVKRAVSAVEELAEKGGGRIFTLGPIIHNDQVVQELEAKGVHAVESIEELAELAGPAADAPKGPGGEDPGQEPRATVVIRSHGIGRGEEERLGRGRGRLSCKRFNNNRKPNNV